MLRAYILACTGIMMACTGSEDENNTPLEAAETYDFSSRFDANSSVFYNNQIFRHTLIDDMKSHSSELTERINSGWFPAPGEVEQEMLFYLDFDSASAGTVSHLTQTNPMASQVVYNDIASGSNLWAKVAGNDSVGQHKEWATEFVGWDEEGITTPESLIRHWIETLDTAATDWSNGEPALDPTGIPVAHVYLTSDGQDLRQLLQKFTRMSIAYSQGTDDYLDADLPGKGLLAAHSSPDEGKNYSSLEHNWDEAWGYFGGARTYGSWSDEQLADSSHFDINDDGQTDLTREFCWGHSRNAGKRDFGSAASAPTTFTEDAWFGFAAGRQFLSEIDGDLSAEQQEQLLEYRDQAITAWEGAIAATVVHYINDVLADMNQMDTEDYDFAAHAKHWSEAKGFALGLQFNPHSPLSSTDFAALHNALGTAPVLSTADTSTRNAYRSALLDAKDRLGATYGFDDANLGGEHGEDGW